MSDRDLWQEIERLRSEVRRLDSLLSSRMARLEEPPEMRLVSVTVAGTDAGGAAVKTTKERTVDAVSSDTLEEVYSLDSDPGPAVGDSAMVGLDGDGKRYFWPSRRLIAVEDVGSGQGRRVEISSGGVSSVPVGSETLPYVVAEPAANFHQSTPPTATGRIYPGYLAKDSGGTRYYIVFVEAKGAQVHTFSKTLSLSGVSSITWTVSTDGQGNVTAINLQGT